MVKTADAVLVVLVPGMGDDIQAIKAGILEIADLFVVNKADRPGADRLESELTYMLSLAPGNEEDRPEILHTIAVRDEGVVELRDAVTSWLDRRSAEKKSARRRERAHARFLSVLTDRLLTDVLAQTLDDNAVSDIVDSISERRTDPYTAVDGIVSRVEVR